jgi:hypothetical protein
VIDTAQKSTHIAMIVCHGDFLHIKCSDLPSSDVVVHASSPQGSF